MLQQNKVIVSLTSFPAAIVYVAKAIRSIMEGSQLPDKVVLYLTFAQFGKEGIPQELQSMTKEFSILEIKNYDQDIRSYRKLVPALEDFPDAIIVTIDDDVWYKKNMLRDLLRLHKEHPHAILTHRAKRIKLNAPYRKWTKYRWYSFVAKRIQPKFTNIQTGVGGVLYPPHSLKKEMIDPKLFTEIAPTTDDIWFWAAAVASGTKIMPVPFGQNKPHGLGKPKTLSLKTVNFKSGIDLNCAALEKILEIYPEIKQRIENEK
ncbi:MAG: hypothetical protein ACK5MI_06105 [Mangrovibacterium sp.]